MKLNGLNKLKILKYTALALLTLFALPQSAFAQCVPGAPCVTGDYAVNNNENADKTGGAETCDGDFMNQIYARAFMEAQRDVMMAETYIRKPDSTLEYTCFDRILNHAAQSAPPMFSENLAWDGRTVPLNIAFTAAGNPTSIDISVSMGVGHIIPNMQSVVADAMTEYLQNFTHAFLGGTGGMDSSMSTSVSSASYTCTSMDAIWMIARCQNFPVASDLFYTFTELAASDPRQFPAPGACASPITTELITTAANPAPAFDTATFDALDIYSDTLLPAPSDAECLDPIGTGTQSVIYEFVAGAATAANPSGITRQGIEFDEMVCINPGCYFDFDPTFGGGPGGAGTITNQRCTRG